MKRQKLKILLDAVNTELSKAEIHYKESKTASEKMSETARASWSSAGDREYAMGQEEVTKLKLTMLENLSNELTRAVGKAVPEKVVAPCFVKVHIGGEDIEFYLVKNIAVVERFKIVSVNSPVGGKIVSKKKYESYNIAKITGKIVGIE
jgi:hypothetical protein